MWSFTQSIAFPTFFRKNSVFATGRSEQVKVCNKFCPEKDKKDAQAHTAKNSVFTVCFFMSFCTYFQSLLLVLSVEPDRSIQV